MANGKWQMAKFKWFAIWYFNNHKPFAICRLPFELLLKSLLVYLAIHPPSTVRIDPCT
jgi:hypothetical protein